MDRRRLILATVALAVVDTAAAQPPDRDSQMIRAAAAGNAAQIRALLAQGASVSKPPGS
jgi:hypothetical protein